MSLEMRHLRVVAAIAEEGSVTRAGTRLHLTQSALSHQLRDAEEQLGRPLFERRKKRMMLTAAGERLLRCARAVIEEIGEAEREIQRSSPGARGVLRLTTQCYTVYHWLPSRLKVFQKKYPDVDVQLVAEATPQPFEALLGEKLDLALTCTPVRNRKIEYTPLFRDEMVAIFAPGHTWEGKPFVGAQDFADADLIIYPPKAESSVLLKLLNPAGVTPRRIREVMLTEAIVELVKAGMGVAVLTKWSVAPQLASGELKSAGVTREGFYRDWSIAHLKTKSNPAYIDDFIKLLAEHPIQTSVMKPPRNRQAKRAARQVSAGRKKTETARA